MIEGRAGSFGDDAEQYDRARLSYPAALVDDLAREGVHTVLDVGCGTGIASRLFAARDCAVLGVEPDPRMAAVARRGGLDVAVAPFERWDPETLRAVLSEVGEAIDRLGGRIEVDHVAWVVTARRASSPGSPPADGGSGSGTRSTTARSRPPP